MLMSGPNSKVHALNNPRKCSTAHYLFSISVSINIDYEMHVIFVRSVRLIIQQFTYMCPIYSHFSTDVNMMSL